MSAATAERRSVSKTAMKQLRHNTAAGRSFHENSKPQHAKARCCDNLARETCPGPLCVARYQHTLIESPMQGTLHSARLACLPMRLPQPLRAPLRQIHSHSSMPICTRFFACMSRASPPSPSPTLSSSVSMSPSLSPSPPFTWTRASKAEFRGRCNRSSHWI